MRLFDIEEVLQHAAQFKRGTQQQHCTLYAASISCSNKRYTNGIQLCGCFLFLYINFRLCYTTKLNESKELFVVCDLRFGSNNVGKHVQMLLLLNQSGGSGCVGATAIAAFCDTFFQWRQ